TSADRRIRLLLSRAPSAKREAIVRRAGLAQSTVSRSCDGASLRRVDKCQQALHGLGAQTAIENLALTSLDEEALNRVHWLVNQASRVDASSVNAFAQIPAAHRRLDGAVGAHAPVRPTRAQARTPTTPDA